MRSVRALLDDRFEPYKEHGVLFVRALVGVRLIYGTQDNVLSWARMVEFADFLRAHGVPAPVVAANVSAWAQFLCGILLLLGFWTRPAALVMVVNFLAALAIAHREGEAATFLGMYQALTMLLGAAFLLVHGPGAGALDGRLRGR